MSAAASNSTTAPNYPGAPDSPGAPHVVVVGAGMVGVATAIWLRRAGHRVTIIDREGPAAGASYGNAGVLASASIVQVPAPGLWRRVPAMLFGRDGPLFLRWGSVPRLAGFLLRYLRSARDWEKTAGALSVLLHDAVEQHEALARGTAAERFITRDDYVFAYADRAAFEADGAGWRVRQRHGHRFEPMDGATYARWDPVFEGRFGFGVRLLDHGRISDPGAYLRALFDHAVERGVSFRRGTVEWVGDDATVHLVNGERVEASHTVVTAGVWSDALLPDLHVPLAAERGYHLEFTEPSHVPRAPTMIAAGKFVLTPMEGRLRAAGVVEFGPRDAKRSRAPLDLLYRQTMRALPALEFAERREWMGHRPAPVDSRPLIGRARKGLNLWAGFGHHHVGLTGGPKTGRWLAGMIGGDVPNTDLVAFDPERFQQRSLRDA